MTADTLKRPLTPAERELTQRYHNLIYRVINDTHAYTDVSGDLYGDCALALILAAQRYTEKEELHKYSFSTIAYARIRSVIGKHKRHYANSPIVHSLDTTYGADGALFYDVVPNANAVNPEMTVIQRLNPDKKPDLRHKKFRVVNGGLLSRQEAA